MLGSSSTTRMRWAGAVLFTTGRSIVAFPVKFLSRLVRTAHTADLDTATLTAARSLLDAVFKGELTEHDWEHALGESMRSCGRETS